MILWCVALCPHCHANSNVSTMRPVLIEISGCADIVDALTRDQLDSVYAKNVVLLSEIEKTSRASVAQLVRARDCQSLGRRFDSV